MSPTHGLGKAIRSPSNLLCRRSSAGTLGPMPNEKGLAEAKRRIEEAEKALLGLGKGPDPVDRVPRIRLVQQLREVSHKFAASFDSPVVGVRGIQSVTKTITCKKCERSFMAVGLSGTLREVVHGIRCPYSGCFEMNELVWTIDGSFYPIEIPKEFTIQNDQTKPSTKTDPWT